MKIAPDLPLDVAALVGCGVTTGWGSAVRAAGGRAGETVVVMGAGGVGMNAVQGAAAAGARYVIVVDPAESKRTWAPGFGATHAFASVDEAGAALTDLTDGRLADKVIITVGEIHGEHIAQALSLAGKRGRVVVTGMGSAFDSDVKMGLFELTSLEKQVHGSLFGSANPRAEIPALLELYRQGRLNLDGLVTTRYRLEQINQGYQDMRNGSNIRGLIVYTDADR